MAVSHISDLKYKGFHPIDKRKTIKIANKCIDHFNQLNSDIYTESEKIYLAFCTEIKERVQESSLFYHRIYLVKFIGSATSKAWGKIDKSFRSREDEFARSINEITENPKLTLEKITKNLGMMYGHTGESGYKESAINKLKDTYEQIMADAFLKMKGYLREQQQKKAKELIVCIEKLLKDIDAAYPEGNPYRGKAVSMKTSLEELQQILSGKIIKINKDSSDNLIKCIEGHREAKAIIQSDRHLEFAPFPKCDNMTNKIIISFMGIITDGGADLTQMVHSYIKKP